MAWRIRNWRWWEWVSVTMVVAMVGLVVILLIQQPQYPARPVFNVLAAIAVTFLTWMCWVSPFLEAGAPRRTKLEHPGSYLNGLRLTAWVPVMLLCLLALAPVFAWVELLRRTGQGPPGGWWPLMIEYKSLFLLPLFLVPVPLTVHFLVTRRFLRALRDMRICFRCGYDLRGSPMDGACPECGRK